MIARAPLWPATTTGRTRLRRARSSRYRLDLALLRRVLPVVVAGHNGARAIMKLQSRIGQRTGYLSGRSDRAQPDLFLIGPDHDETGDENVVAGLHFQPA